MTLDKSLTATKVNESDDGSNVPTKFYGNAGHRSVGKNIFNYFLMENSLESPIGSVTTLPWIPSGSQTRTPTLEIQMSFREDFIDLRETKSDRIQIGLMVRLNVLGKLSRKTYSYHASVSTLERRDADTAV